MDEARGRPSSMLNILRSRRSLVLVESSKGLKTGIFRHQELKEDTFVLRVREILVEALV